MVVLVSNAVLAVNSLVLNLYENHKNDRFRIFGGLYYSLLSLKVL